MDHGANPNTRSVRLRGSAANELTPLAAATLMIETFGLEMLLAHGAEMDHTALFAAMSTSYDQSIRVAHMTILIDHGADVNYRTANWGTPLHYAVRRNRREELRFLLERGADRTIRNLLGRTPAELALDRGKLDLFAILEGDRIS